MAVLEVEACAQRVNLVKMETRHRFVIGLTALGGLVVMAAALVVFAVLRNTSLEGQRPLVPETQFLSDVVCEEPVAHESPHVAGPRGTSSSSAVSMICGAPNWGQSLAPLAPVSFRMVRMLVLLAINVE